MILRRAWKRDLQAAGPDLLSLSLSGSRTPEYSVEFLLAPEIGKLSSLTNLELSGFWVQSQSDLTPLHGLGLQELVLSNCINMEAALFVPGAFPALVRLDIEETREFLATKIHDIEARRLQRQLQSTGEAVPRLPCLKKLSGTSKALSAWMDSAGGCKAWTLKVVGPKKPPKVARAARVRTYIKTYQGSSVP